ncbi:glycoside hydrolase family 3 N-terminal domain-containing protein [Cumulibacter manganitolerans]|uniref:glycoside hydrolase family 3 N-terminal domain-containing protein n=1 Tax=Cumulibacter manganitolerans TaxID=1884992 RepID=UPI001E2BB2BB|nr:glycoside hydrolase family 3 N-terminal domain-containing protein [Cumulibacter manganitolerans]
MRTTRRRTCLAALATIGVLTGAACGPGGRDAAGPATPSGSSSPTSAPSDAAVPTSGPAQTGAAPAQTCAQRIGDMLSPQQKAAQLILVAMTPGSTADASAQLKKGNAGGVFLLGGWPSQAAAKQATDQIHAQSASTAQIGTWVAIDQEGGQVQQLKGPGVSSIPSALDQAMLGPETLRAQAAQWAQQLKQAGIDINLAPVADVVPADIGKKNGPIGRYDRQYGDTPQAVTAPMIAFLQGMQDGGIAATVKHFPGIGRITGNTDQTASGIDDDVASAADPALAPFQSAIQAGVPIVMVSTARYPQLDPQNQAAFSGAIIDGLLRGQLGFTGVTFTDDVGAAKSVADVPVADRITRYLEAGGDVVLTAVPTQAQTMAAAVVAQYGAEPAFAAKVDAAVDRVLALKEKQHLLPCSG